MADLPDAVGPQMTGMVTSDAEASAPPETALELIPRELNDDGPAVNVVRGQRAVAERHEQGAHLLGRERVTSLDGRLARDRRGKMLMARGARRRPVAGESRQGIPQTPLRIEPRMRGRDSMDDDGLPAELRELVPERLQEIAVRVERFGFDGCELKRQRKEQAL